MTERVGDTFTDDYDPRSYTDVALGAIANELRRIRLLEEYKHQVLVTEDPSGNLVVVAGEYHDDLRLEQGTVLYDEHTGSRV
jgi:hypothetical protein